VKPKPIDWLWKFWIAIGKVSVLAGDSGNEGVDEALEEPLNDGAEGRADDDSDGEVNNVAPHHEILETLEHGCESFQR